MTDVCVQALVQASDAVATERPADAAEELERIKSRLDALIREAEVATYVHCVSAMGGVKPER